MIPLRHLFRDILLSLLFILIQTTIVPYLAIVQIVPDLLLIWIVYLALRRGQITATAAGFFIGLILDLLSGSDGMLGLSALCKTVAGFTAGYFYNENKTVQTLGGYQFLLIVTVASFTHNLIYFLVLLQGTSISWWGILFRHGIPTMLYTAALGLLPMFAFERKYLT